MFGKNRTSKALINETSVSRADAETKHTPHEMADLERFMWNRFLLLVDNLYFSPGATSQIPLTTTGDDCDWHIH